jgi:hypothetical protein
MSGVRPFNIANFISRKIEFSIQLNKKFLHFSTKTDSNNFKVVLQMPSGHVPGTAEAR